MQVTFLTHPTYSPELDTYDAHAVIRKLSKEGWLVYPDYLINLKILPDRSFRAEIASALSWINVCGHVTVITSPGWNTCPEVQIHLAYAKVMKIPVREIFPPDNHPVSI